MHAGHLDVVDVSGRAGDQARIFAPADALADQSLGFWWWCSRHGMPSAAFRRGRGFHRVDDVLISGAAADVALEAVADLLLGRVGIAIDDLLGRHDHAGRAEAALQSVLVPESLLHRVELAVSGQAFDGQDARAVGLHGEHGAAFDGLAVHLDRACAAQRRLAADVRSGEADDLAQVVDEEQPRLDVVGITSCR